MFRKILRSSSDVSWKRIPLKIVAILEKIDWALDSCCISFWSFLLLALSFIFCDVNLFLLWTSVGLLMIAQIYYEHQNDFFKLLYASLSFKKQILCPINSFFWRRLVADGFKTLLKLKHSMMKLITLPYILMTVLWK